MDIEYGVATLAELPRIVEMKMAMFDEAGHRDLLNDNAISLVLNDYERVYREGIAAHFVARDNGEIIASAGAFIKSDLPFCYFDPAIYGFIGDVFTEKAYRGRGISTVLNKDALKWLKIKGVLMVRLLASEAGRPIYERLGFQPTDEMALKLET